MSKALIISKLTKKLRLPERSVANTIHLLDEGATLPFIARYRKEMTGSLDEVQIADIENGLHAINELIKRKSYILKTIEEQGKLTTDLKRKIDNCWEERPLEDMYLPYKQSKQTRAAKAIQFGLSDLANEIWYQRSHNMDQLAKSFLNDSVTHIEDALQGARNIIAAKINEQAEVREMMRNLFRKEGMFHSKVVKKKESEASKFKDYYDYSEYAKKAASHRILAIYRGESEGFLKVKINIDKESALHYIKRRLLHSNATSSCRHHMEEAIQDAYSRLLEPSIEKEFRTYYKNKADAEAIKVFNENLKQLLLAPPLGSKRTIGIDPGFRTGCKVVCIDQNGILLHNLTIYPNPPQNQFAASKEQLEALVNKYHIEAIAIGNGTAGKETYALVKAILFKTPIEIFMVNENGASIYSASEVARKEFPNKDITVRGAVSIARRLMDPLSELVKIEPKSIGVGQYQHDVNQTKLKAELSRCVESCVNAVGIDLNTASEHVLTYVSGLGPSLAKNIVDYRKTKGSYFSIQELLKVPRMGAKAYEQCAGFLRIRSGKNMLDNTGVHPERYALVKRMAKDMGISSDSLIQNRDAQNSIHAHKYVSDEIGLPTIKYIIEELNKTGLDIRGAAKTFEFTLGLSSMDDLHPGMMVKGIINNITSFGAFVDIGLKQSGLIHVSQLADQFVKDPLEVVQLNQEVYARVLELDVSRARISLSLKK